MRNQSSHVWDGAIGEAELEIYREAGFGAYAGPGVRPALLIVDVTYNFTGDRPEPIRDSIRRFPTSCGAVAWEAMERISLLLEIARSKSLPTFFTRGLSVESHTGRGSWLWKTTSDAKRDSHARTIGNEIPDAIRPIATDIVIEKTKPSAFFATPLASYLIANEVDTVIVTGTTTSGCIRATVIDAFSLNFRTVVVEDAVFDRGELVHKVNLFDMHAKYADIIPTEAIAKYLQGVGTVTIGN